MLEKLLDTYCENKPSYKDASITYSTGEKIESTTSAPKKDDKLEKKVLTFFGILLQLIVFYLPLMNVIFRGKTIPGILS